MGTGMGGAAAQFGGMIREGKYTEQIYGMIRDGKFQEAISILQTKVLEFPNSRAAASLLGHCQYQISDFQSAITTYERLMRLCPDVPQNRLSSSQ